jgi:transposase-like protein
MVAPRKTHGPAFKVKVAMEAAKELKTINEIAGEHGIHPAQVTKWKKQLVEALHDVFAHGNSKKNKKKKTEDAALYQEIGQLTVEVNWLKKKLGLHS